MDALAVLLPRRCGVCRAPGASLCARCRRDLVRVVPPMCERCGAPGPWPVRRCVECARRRLGFASARAAVVYEQRARALVSSWKERGRRDLTKIAADLVLATVARPSVEALVFVPADTDRTLKRGPAVVESFTRALGASWEIEVRPALRRARSGPRQRGASLAKRRANVRALYATRGPVPPSLCLVDDVYTTGSTASACSRVLRHAGADHVEVVTLARAVRSR
jgi:predicted amidophosphoribosyltransferase